MTTRSKVTRDQIQEAWRNLRHEPWNGDTKMIEDVLWSLDIAFEPETALEEEVRQLSDRLTQLEPERKKWWR